MVWPKMIPLQWCPLYFCMLAYLFRENGSEQLRSPKRKVGVDVEPSDAGRKTSDVVDFPFVVAVDIKPNKMEAVVKGCCFGCDFVIACCCDFVNICCGCEPVNGC